MEERAPSGKRRIALLIQYDGTRFHGFQRQDNGHTVQAEIENAIAVLTRAPVTLYAAGRTDTGVHARGQVVHFETDSALSLRRFAIGLNGILPRSVSVSDVYDVPASFHSRFDAKWREYRYCIYNHPYRSALIDKRALWYPGSLDIDRLNESCRYLLGEHDFTALCRPGKTGSVRRIISAHLEKEGCDVVFRVRADSFLHNMIRIIIGTLLKINENSYDPGFMDELMRSRDRSRAGETAPPWALYLERVGYSPPLEAYPSASAELERMNIGKI